MTDRASHHEELRRLAVEGRFDELLAEARELHPSDLSDVLAGLDEDLRLRVAQALPAEVVSDALAEMEEEEHPEALLAAMRPEHAADIVEELADDDAVDLISDLPQEAADGILASVADRADIERLMVYDEESAGGLMTTALVSVSQHETAQRAIEHIRRQAEEVGEFYQVYCVDDRYHLVGILPLQKVVVAPADRLVADVMERPLAIADPSLDQEEVARLMAHYNVPAVPVVDASGKLLGRVTFDDVIDVVEAESTEDLLKFGGVSGHEELGGRWHDAVRSRLPWLYLNLFTASFAAAVVYFFQDTISRLVALAVWMPVIAGMGGNAGTQALAVTVRRIALGLPPGRSAMGVVVKELAVGVINGLAVGVVVAVAAAALGQGWLLGVVVMLAMWGNLVVAATLGAGVPIVLKRLGADPAVASSVFVTAFTDMVGFFLLLGLAAAIVLPAG